SFYKKKLVGMSRELYLEHGWDMPRGIEVAGRRDPTNFSLAEWQQAKRQGTDPRLLKAELQSCWKTSDNKQAFGRALEERGYFLAKGDKRSFVVLGYDGEVHSLPRALGLKTKDLAARLGDGGELRSVADTQKVIAERMRPAIRRHIQESRERFQERSAKLGAAKEAMTRDHRKARLDLDQRHKAEWLEETKARASRLPRGLSGLWHRLTGKYQETRRQNEREAAQSTIRQGDARQALADAQLGQRQGLQAEIKALRKGQAMQLLELRREVGRFFAMSGRRDERAAQDRAQEVEPPRRSRERDERREESRDGAAEDRRAARRGLSRGLKLER
ncbi:MAG: Relaxase/mobilization nuclease family protein, partial [Spirosoma sp.]|nr:Relaxase/mobilization nuclease family protein [Spirosoma sp.]